MTPRQLAATVAAIMTAVPTASPSAVVDRLCNTLGVVPEPQRAAIDFSVRVALELTRELCEHLFHDVQASFNQLDRLDNHTAAAFLRYLLETLSDWHRRPSLRDD